MTTTITSYTDELARERDRYRRLGEDEAAKLCPPSDADSLDKHEVELRSDAERHLSTQREFFNAELQQATTALSSLEQRLIQWRIKCDTLLSEPDFSRALDGSLAENKPNLVPLTVRRMRTEVALRTYRSRTGIPLDEQARYPESIIWHFGLVMVIGFGETFMNAVFYQNDQGLLGGLLIAVLVAIVNLGFSVVLGWGARYRNLKQPDKKALGWFAVVLFLVWVLFANALFAAFRAEYQRLSGTGTDSGMSEAFRSALDNAIGLFTFDLTLTDFQSFILFGMGILFGALAFWKGLTSDDKYPGHSQLDREWKAARAQEQSALESTSEHVRQLLRQKIAETQVLLTEPPQIIAGAVARAGALAQAAALLGARRQAIQRDFELVLSTYRQSNISIRVTPPPAYFSTTPSLPGADLGPAYEHTREGFERLKADANSARAEAEGRVQARVTELMSLNNGLGDRLKHFVSTVLAEATEHIDSEQQTLRRLLT